MTVTVKGRRLAAANSKWKVYLDHLIDQQGNEVVDYLVVEAAEPRPEYVIGVAVLAIVEDKFLLMRSHRHPFGTELWEVPHGFVDVGEDPGAAAIRELAEETGLHCESTDLVSLGRYAPEAGTMAARGALFAARRCTGSLRQATDEIGLGTPQLFSRAHTAEMVASGEIEDAATLLLFYRYSALSS